MCYSSRAGSSSKDQQSGTWLFHCAEFWSAQVELGLNELIRADHPGWEAGKTGRKLFILNKKKIQITRRNTVRRNFSWFSEEFLEELNKMCVLWSFCPRKVWREQISCVLMTVSFSPHWREKMWKLLGRGGQKKKKMPANYHICIPRVTSLW